jgi:hypothetical protein
MKYPNPPTPFLSDDFSMVPENHTDDSQGGKVKK